MSGTTLKVSLGSGLLAVLFLLPPALAQENPSLKKRADEYYLKGEYFIAAQAYQKLADRKRPSVGVLERLAESYLEMDRYEEAERWYAQLVSHEEADPEHRIGYATALKNNEKYAEAKAQLELYASSTGDGGRVAREIAGCDSALKWTASPTLHQLHNEVKLNTKYAEFGAWPYQGYVLLAGESVQQALEGGGAVPVPMTVSNVNEYTRTGRPYLKLRASWPESSGRLQQSIRIRENFNNGRLHIGPATANRMGDTVWFTRTYRKDLLQTESFEGLNSFRLGSRRLELYYITRTPKGKWSSPHAFTYNDPEAYSVGLAALSADGNTLYFTSDMPGGHGGTDIWYCRKEGEGAWSAPVNCGTAINSEGNEMYPFMSEDGYLYFSSDGKAGMGGLDVFRAKGEHGQWGTAANMRYPINSARDDFAYVEAPGKEVMYLSSNRSGGKGEDDIYRIDLKVPEKISLVLEGLVLDEVTGKELKDVNISLNDDRQTAVNRGQSDSDGKFYFELDRDKAYEVYGQFRDFESDSATLSTAGIIRNDTLRVTLKLKPVYKKGKTFRLKNIHYDLDRWDIRPDAARVLNDLVTTLRDHPSMKIELSAHTDSRGDDAYNLRLSQQRAEAAVTYLVSQGISRDRLKAKGYGESQLLNHCSNGVSCSEAEHEENRRTEFTVLDY